MKKMKNLICAVCLLMVLTGTNAGAQTLTNLSVKAIGLSASVNSDDHPVSLINDNRIGSASYWSSYHGDEWLGQYEYVELRWDRHNIYKEVRAYWASDDEQILQPNDAYVALWDGHQWLKGSTLAEADAKGVSTTEVELTTNRLRVYVRSEKACGIRELKILGYLGDECQPAILQDNSTVIWEQGTTKVLSPKLVLPEGEEEEPIWNWLLPDGSTATMASVTVTEPGEYQVSYQRQCGAVTELTYLVYDPAVSYVWPKYSPTLYYDYRNEYPALDPPTRMLPENNNAQGYMADGWWAVAWGPRTNPYVTETAKTNLLNKMNEDFAFFRDEMGWPPDKRARNG